MIKVLIVEDSPVARELLKHVLGSDPDIEVIGVATNGQEAIDLLSLKRPDVITMDVIMPKMDGLEATRKIMASRPLPIVVVSASFKKAEVDKTFKALEAGAVAVLQKPRGKDLGIPGSDAEKLIRTVKAMSQVRVVRRWDTPSSAGGVRNFLVPELSKNPRRDTKVVVIGASTGGPGVIQSILAGLPREFPAPILLVQHISPGFTQGLVDWLDSSCVLHLHVAVDGERARPGNVYVAPDGAEMTIDRRLNIRLLDSESTNGNVSSVSCLFRSVAEAVGAKAIGVLLTGMGRDGARGLKLMRDRGAVTIAQNKETSIVYGMPGEAIRLGAAEHSLSPRQIVHMLKSLIEVT